MLVGCATAASLFPFVGTIVYMIVRPPEYLEDVRERELEMQAAEARLHEPGYLAVPALRPRGRGATSCAARTACASSRTPAELRQAAGPAWKICPYCEAEIPGHGPAPRRRPAAARPSRPSSEQTRLVQSRRRSAAARVPPAPLIPRQGLEHPDATRTLILVKPDASRAA